MENSNSSKKQGAPQEPARQRHKGIDPKGVFKELIKQDFDPTRVEVKELTFVSRIIQTRGGEKEQILSFLDLGPGMGMIEVYPACRRFKPKKRKIVCFVCYRQGKKKDRDGEEVTVFQAFSIPENLQEAAKNGEWLGVSNNILRLKFRKNPETGDYYAHDENGKVVLVRKGASFEPSTTEEADYLVSESLNFYLAHCVVEPEERVEIQQSAGRQKYELCVLTETAGAELRAVDTYRIEVDGESHDICTILDIPPTASEQEVKEAYWEMAASYDFDKRCAEARRHTGKDLPESVKAQYTWQRQLVEAAKERFLTILAREKNRERYLAKGKRALPNLLVEITVKDLAVRLETSVAAVQAALKEIGFGAKNAKAPVSQVNAWTAAGLIVSGNLKVEEPVAKEPEPKEKKEKVPDPALVKLATAMGAKLDGKRPEEFPTNSSEKKT